MTMESVAANPILMATSVTNVLLVTTTFHLAQVDQTNSSSNDTISDVLDIFFERRYLD